MGSSVTGTSVKNHPFLKFSLWVVLVFWLECGIFRQAQEKTKAAKIRMSASSPLCFYLNVEKKIIPWVGWGTWDLMSHRTLNNRKRDPLGKVWKPRSNQCATQLVLFAGNSLPCAMHNLHPEVYSSTSQKNPVIWEGPILVPVFASLSTLQLDFRRVLN